MTNIPTLLILCAAIATPALASAETVSATGRKPVAATLKPAKLTEARRVRYQRALDRKFPQGAHAMEARLAAKLTPAGREWAARMAYAYATGQVTEAEVRNEAAKGATAYTATWGSTDMDIEAMIFIVMMEAAKSAQEDLKAIMADVKATNKAKESQRRTQQNLNKLAAAAASTTASGTAPLDSQALLGKSICEIEACDLRADPGSSGQTEARDSQSEMGAEMGEMESLRLQMAMDRVAKMMSTLSNILKKMSDTQQTIIQNLK